MQSFKMPLADMKKPEENIRNHTEKQLKEYERSVKMFGQIRPIVVDEEGVIIAGVGLYETMKRLGYQDAEVYQFTDLTPNQKKKLMIADNKIFNLGVDNLDTLNDFIESMKDDLDIPGFDADILKDMVADAEEVTATISEYGKLDQQAIEGIKAAEEKREIAAERQPVNTENPSPMLNVPAQHIENPLAADTLQFADMESGGTTADVRKFIICPKCGEKIWL